MVITGVYYALALIAGGVVVSLLTGPVYGVVFYALAAFCLYFFRDPERDVPQGPHAVSPADGKVVAVKKEPGDVTRVSIFLNIFDVHVNRTPIAGRITRVAYTPGRFHIASREEASSANEQNTVIVEAADGVSITFKQIAGLIARRIIFRKKIGDSVAMGERVGLIQFGSRVDVLFGPEWSVQVGVGQRVRAAASILARRKAAA